jgi:transcription antitermination factor NusG
MDTRKLYDEMHWFAFYVKARHEKKVCERLTQLNIETYLPLVTKISQWSDRKKKIEEPLIRGFIFCRMFLKDRIPILETPGVVNIFRFAGKWTIIPDYEIESIRIALEAKANLVLEDHFILGRKVKIIEGQFKGLVGRIVTLPEGDSLYLEFEKLQLSFKLKVEVNDLELSDEAIS